MKRIPLFTHNRGIYFNRYIKGIVSIFNIFGSNVKSTHYPGNITDILAIENDWYTIANDMKKVLNNGR